MTRLKFSVVMPSFNHGIYISKAIDSVIGQTFKEWELIIIDNHSTDDTCDIIKAYADERIKVNFVHNQGSIAFSRNIGISMASAPYICFLDSDDWWEQTKLDEIFSVITKEEPDLLFHEERWHFK